MFYAFYSYLSFFSPNHLTWEQIKYLGNNYTILYHIALFNHLWGANYSISNKYIWQKQNICCIYKPLKYVWVDLPENVCNKPLIRYITFPIIMFCYVTSIKDISKFQPPPTLRWASVRFLRNPSHFKISFE